MQQRPAAAGKVTGSRRPSVLIALASPGDGRGLTLGLCSAAEVAVVEPADVGQGNDAAVLG